MRDEVQYLYEKRPDYHEKRSDHYEITIQKDSIEYLLPEWVSILKKYFTKYSQVS